MIKGFFLGLLLTMAAGTCAVQAQSSTSDNGGPASQPTDTELLNKNYLTPTGETVPHPGEPQGGPTTKLDRRIEQQDNQLDQSICSNCK
jgi:hypothetical protein